MSDLLVSGLWPPFGAAVQYLLTFLRSYGLQVDVVSGYRSQEEQAKLYAQGRTPAEITARVKKRGAGGTVTDAPPGYSAHNYGLAVDLESPDLELVMQIARQVGFGTVSWDPDHLEWPRWQQLVGV